MTGHALTLVYLVSAAGFILALKWLSAVPTARRGVAVGAAGMLLAVVATLLEPSIENYRWIAVAFAVGAAIGIPMAMMPMTAVPQRTALSHAFGALAAALVGTSEYYLHAPAIGRFQMGAIALEVLLGGLTVTASLMAFGKLQELLPTRPVVWRGQNRINLSVFALAFGSGAWLVARPDAAWIFPFFLGFALLFGVLLVLPIGGADMPTVISLLNAYAGLSAAAMGFVLDNKLLIVAGSLDGSSGLILSIVMCRAMNRSFANVLFGGFGQLQAAAEGGEERIARSAAPEDAAEILRAASRVVVVPGYGMAVAQAQHKVREMYELLSKAGVSVSFAIHPVAGRMPGHMNVLLAEANVPYDRLLEMDDANAEFPQADVALVLGANDVTNPAARTDKGSPIYGMPILDVDRAQTVIVVKRGMSPGFAGIDNPLYYLDNTLMVFGDAKSVVGEIVKALGDGAGR